MTCDFSLCGCSRAALPQPGPPHDRTQLPCDAILSKECSGGGPSSTPEIQQILGLLQIEQYGPPLMRYQGSDGAWPRCTDVGGGSIKLVAVQGTSGSHGLGQMQPISSVTGEELDIDTPLEKMPTIQERYVKYSRAITMPSLLSKPAQCEIPTKTFKPRWLTLRTTSSLTIDHVRRPRTVKSSSSNDTRQQVHAECGTKGFNACKRGELAEGPPAGFCANAMI